MLFLKYCIGQRELPGLPFLCDWFTIEGRSTNLRFFTHPTMKDLGVFKDILCGLKPSFYKIFTHFFLFQNNFFLLLSRKEIIVRHITISKNILQEPLYPHAYFLFITLFYFFYFSHASYD